MKKYSFRMGGGEEVFFPVSFYLGVQMGIIKLNFLFTTSMPFMGDYVVLLIITSCQRNQVEH